MKLMEIKGEIVLLNLLDDCNPVATETGICGNGAKRQAKASQILKRNCFGNLFNSGIKRNI